MTLNLLMACTVLSVGFLIGGCKQPEKKLPDPTPPAVSERVINPWSSSSSPSAPYQPLAQPSGVINPWVRPQAVSPAEAPLPAEFAGVPRAAILTSEPYAAPAPDASDASTPTTY